MFSWFDLLYHIITVLIILCGFLMFSLMFTITFAVWDNSNLFTTLCLSKLSNKSSRIINNIDICGIFIYMCVFIFNWFSCLYFVYLKGKNNILEITVLPSLSSCIMMYMYIVSQSFNFLIMSIHFYSNIYSYYSFLLKQVFELLKITSNYLHNYLLNLNYKENQCI